MSALNAARLKLSQGDPPFNLYDLPNERNDGIWNDIMLKYALTLPELSALKNAHFSCKFDNLSAIIVEASYILISFAI